MKTVALLMFLSLPGMATIAAGKPVDPLLNMPLFEVSDASDERSRSVLTTTSSTMFADTVWYGGTYWAADSLRWEALRNGRWTFDTGIGSAYGVTGPNKPAGYHTRMEGWTGLDQSLYSQPWFRRSSTCAINGSFSFWAGVTETEGDFCYAGGQGYGNGWQSEITKAFVYPGTGNAGLSYSYAIDCEPSFDFVYALIDTTGDGSEDDVNLREYTGAVSGTEVVNLVRGTTLRSTPGPVIIKFRLESDGSYSDEDGLYSTVCGAVVVDDVILSGAIVDFSDFESGENGWVQTMVVTGTGDFSNITHLSELPPPATFCECGISDSVLVFFNEMMEHEPWQDNIAYSPWIDLKRGGDTGRSGKIISYDVYAEMPMANFLYAQVRVRYFPMVCPYSGRLVSSPWRDQNVIYYYGESPYCTFTGLPRLLNYSSVIPPTAEQVQVAVGVWHYASCTFSTCWNGITNSTPWFDNISLGITGPITAPPISLTASDYFQDAFAADGTVSPFSSGRFDPGTAKTGSSPVPGSVLRDTLVAHGDGGNTEVRMVFRVRPGPFTSMLSYYVWTSRWTAEPGLTGWFSARMDTAEQAGIRAQGNWMSTFHESDPGFSGTDQSPDPVDSSQLANEILPDHILTPGSRIDYFLKSRYIPTDPRNPGGTSWFILPDTTGGRYLEVEILPSSMTADTTWNCTLYVDHHHDRELDHQAVEEAALSSVLGSGPGNGEGTRFDRWDVQNSASTQVSFGRPPGTSFGASLDQALLYRTIIWHSGGLASQQLTSVDAAVLGPFLEAGNSFWGTGNGLATSMNATGGPGAAAFMRTYLGAVRVCDTVRSGNCPAGSSLDATYCLPTEPVPGAEFVTLDPLNLRGNGCPNLVSFDLINPDALAPDSRGQLAYVKNGSGVSFASVTNTGGGGATFKTVLDGFALGSVRTVTGDPHVPANCTSTVAAFERTADVLQWFGASVSCSGSPEVSAVGEGGEAPLRHNALGPARPNPMTSTSTIAFTNSVDQGHVTIEIFDVTGRLVRKLLDQRRTVGEGQVTWDGKASHGNRVAPGLFFVRMTAGQFQASQKLLVLK